MPIGFPSPHSSGASYMHSDTLPTGQSPREDREATPPVAGPSSAVQPARHRPRARSHPLQVQMRASVKRPLSPDPDAQQTDHAQSEQGRGFSERALGKRRATEKSPPPAIHAGEDAVGVRSENEEITHGDVSALDKRWTKGQHYTVAANFDMKKMSSLVRASSARKSELQRNGYKATASGARELSQACDATPGQYLGEGIFVHHDITLKNGQTAPAVYRLLDEQSSVRDIGVPFAGEMDGMRINTEQAILARMRERIPTLYPLVGSKQYATEQEQSGVVVQALLAALNAPEVNCFADAFAGTAFFSLWMAAQQRSGTVKSGLRLITNEWDHYRHNTLKTVQQHPQQVKEALEWHMQRIRHLYYRVLNDYPIYEVVNGQRVRQSDVELARRIAQDAGENPAAMTISELMRLMNDTVETWIRETDINRQKNSDLSSALKQYVLSSLEYPLPAEPEHSTDEDIGLRASNAALYLLAQHNNRFPSTPINFTHSTVQRANVDPTGLTTGRSGVITNQMLEIPFRIMHKIDGVTKLKFGWLNSETSNDNRAFFDSLPVNIDRMSDALTGAEVMQGDGWKLLDSLKRGALAVVDPLYWEPDGTTRVATYSNNNVPESKLGGFFEQLDRHVMPAWRDRHVRIVMFNRSSPGASWSLQRRGFEVFPLFKLDVTSGYWGSLQEMVAVNFSFDANATLHSCVTLPEPEAPLGVPDIEFVEDSADNQESAGSSKQT